MTVLTKLQVCATLSILLLTTTACSTITDYAASNVKSYCSSTTDAEREVIRERFNSKVYPHQVLIYCEK